MSGFVPVYDEESTDVRVAEDGFPFRVAVLAAIEEVVGVMGDIDEGDVSGRLEDDPDIYKSLEKQREYLEMLTEREAGGVPTRLSTAKNDVLDALVSAGDGIGYIDLLDDHGDFVRKVQRFLNGDAGLTIDDLLADARDGGLDQFIVGMGYEPSVIRSGM